MARRRSHPRNRIASSSISHGTPGAGPKPVRNATQATELAELAVSQPLARETICLFVDEDYRPVTCMVVEGGQNPDDVFGIAEMLTEVALDRAITRLLLVSCRPGRGFEPEDLHRWFGLDRLLGDAGLELIEWFVKDEDLTVAMAALAGEPSRWPPGPG